MGEFLAAANSHLSSVHNRASDRQCLLLEGKHAGFAGVQGLLLVQAHCMGELHTLSIFAFYVSCGLTGKLVLSKTGVAASRPIRHMDGIMFASQSASNSPGLSRQRILLSHERSGIKGHWP